MIEEVPMLISDDEVYLGSIDEDKDFPIKEINFTEFVPGGRWMYSEFRTSSVGRLKLLHFLCYFAEVVSLIVNYQGGIGELFVLQTVVGANVLIFMNFNSAKYLNYFVRDIGYGFLIANCVVIGYYWGIQLGIEEINVALMGFAVIFRETFEDNKDNHLFRIAGVVRSSLLLVASTGNAAVYVQNKYFDGNLHVLMCLSVVLICVYKDISIALGSFYIFCTFLCSDQANIVTQAAISMTSVVILIVFIIFTI